jgi:hypothetical protein
MEQGDVATSDTGSYVNSPLCAGYPLDDAKPTPCSLASPWVRPTHLAEAACLRHHRPGFGICYQRRLQSPVLVVREVRREVPGKGGRLDEEHL